MEFSFGGPRRSRLFVPLFSYAVERAARGLNGIVTVCDTIKLDVLFIDDDGRRKYLFLLSKLQFYTIFLFKLFVRIFIYVITNKYC